VIVLKKIEMTLDPKSIEQAVKEIELFETKLKPAMQFLIDKLAEKGVEIARAHLLFFPKPAYDTGALSESVKYYLKDREATITAGEGLTNAMGEAQYGSYAMYVEYGNGYSRPNGW